MNTFYKLAFTLLLSILMCGCNEPKTHVDHSETIAILQAHRAVCRKAAGQVLGVSEATNKYLKSSGVNTEVHYRAATTRYESDIANCELVFSNNLTVEMAR
jgi:ABC-type uncharacterized transport system auxiliary subunit